MAEETFWTIANEVYRQARYLDHKDIKPTAIFLDTNTWMLCAVECPYEHRNFDSSKRHMFEMLGLPVYRALTDGVRMVKVA